MLYCYLKDNTNKVIDTFLKKQVSYIKKEAAIYEAKKVQAPKIFKRAVSETKQLNVEPLKYNSMDERQAQVISLILSKCDQLCLKTEQYWTPLMAQRNAKLNNVMEVTSKDKDMCLKVLKKLNWNSQSAISHLLNLQ